MQSKNKDGGIQLSTRYQQYMFAKQHLRGTPRPEVFPITGTATEDSGSIGNVKVMDLIVEKVIGKVKVRKYPVDVEKLKTILREHKKPIKNIVEKLGVKKTTVEHWFRKDSSFAIPNDEIWFKLKDFLEIKTDEFDRAITEFEIRDNKFDMANRVYQKEGIAPTLTTLTGGHQHTAVNDGYSIRRLTPLECERLQGFPDDWTKGESMTDRWFAIGNAVNCKVSDYIFNKYLVDLWW